METVEACAMQSHGYPGKSVLRPAVTLGLFEVSPRDFSEEDLWLLGVPYSSQEPNTHRRTREHDTHRQAGTQKEENRERIKGG